MEFLTNALQERFTWGLLLGLLITAFVWKSAFTARRQAARDIRRLETEMADLQKHLNTQLKINATGNEKLQSELESLRQQNEILRVNNHALQQKPGRAEMRLVQIQDNAIRLMREQAPGFAPAWEKALRQAEMDAENADSGLIKLVRRVIPSLGGGHSSSQPTLMNSEDVTEAQEVSRQSSSPADDRP
jgi:regulator of replication initiation timing